MEIKTAPAGCQELQLPFVAGVSNGEFLAYYPPEADPQWGELFKHISHFDDNLYILYLLKM
jgi:hypothetical protein